jgi:CRP-like cAMP-binding protein
MNPGTKHIPFIFLTAKTERSDFRKGMEMGADDYITKPFDDVELLNAVESRLKKAAVLEQAYAATAGGLSQFVKDIKDAGQLQKLAEQYPVEVYGKKEVVYTEGKKPRHLFYLLKGKVKAIKTHEDGKEYITDLYSEGDFLGYAALIEDTVYTDTAKVLQEAEIMQIGREDFLQMMHSDITIASKFIHIMTKNVKEKEERLLSLAYSSLRKRVATALLHIVSKFNLEEQKAPIEISREELAQYVGTATESLIRTISDFKAEKLVETKAGKITVINADRLKKLLN